MDSALHVNALGQGLPGVGMPGGGAGSVLVMWELKAPTQEPVVKGWLDDPQGQIARSPRGRKFDAEEGPDV